MKQVLRPFGLEAAYEFKQTGEVDHVPRPKA